jgi:hypothetical protein
MRALGQQGPAISFSPSPYYEEYDAGMAFVIEVASGAGAGRRFVVPAGQTLHIGYADYADVKLPADEAMAGVHFTLEADQGHCWITDRHSPTGTIVAGTRIQERTRLANGDKFRAGNTMFTFFVGEPDADAPPPAPSPARSRDVTASVVKKVVYTAEQCDSGLTLCRGEISDISPRILADRLGEINTLHLMLDFKNAGLEVPSQLASPNYLFDWLDTAAQPLASPVLMAGAEVSQWPEFVEQSWGKDAVVCLFSDLEGADLAAHLRQMCHPPSRAGSGSNGVLGLCWPSVLAPLLTHFSPDFCRRLMTGIQAVLVELPDLPETWQIYGPDTVAGLLDRLGFTRKPAEPIAPGDVKG